MSQQSILDRIRQQVQNANQGNAAPNPASPSGGFSISNGMMQAPGTTAPKTLSGSYLS